MAGHFKGASASNTEGSLNRIIQVIGIPVRMKGLSGSVHRTEITKSIVNQKTVL